MILNVLKQNDNDQKKDIIEIRVERTKFEMLRENQLVERNLTNLFTNLTKDFSYNVNIVKKLCRIQR
jgi:hypothetical protein